MRIKIFKIIRHCVLDKCTVATVLKPQFRVLVQEVFVVHICLYRYQYSTFNFLSVLMSFGDLVLKTVENCVMVWKPYKIFSYALHCFVFLKMPDLFLIFCCSCSVPLISLLNGL